MQPLEIVVTGNVSGAKSALQTIQGELGKTAISSKKAGDEFDKMNAQMQQFKRAASQSLNPELVGIYNRKVTELQASMKQLASAADGEAASTFKAEAATKAMSVAVNNSTQGAERLHQAIARSTDPLQIAAREINNFSRRLLYMAGASVMQLAIEGFQAILPYIKEFVSGLDNSSYAAKLAAANLANLNTVMADADKKAGVQIADLKILYKAATDVTLSTNQRLAAVKALQKEFPDYFANISTEAIENGKAKKSYDELTISIIAASRASAAKGKIDALESQRLDAIAAQNSATAKANTLNTQLVTNKKSSYASGLVSEGGNDYVTSTAAQIAANNLAANDVIKKQNENIKSIQDQENFLINFAKLPDLIPTTAGGKPSKAKGAKGKDQYTLDLAALEDYYKRVQSQRVKDFDANLTDTKKNTTAVNDILLRDELDFLEKKLQLIRKYGKKEGDTKLLIAKTNQKAVENQRLFTQDQLNTLPKVHTATVLNLKSTSDKIDPQVYYKVSDAIAKNIKDQAKMLEMMQQTALYLDKYLGPAFDAMFTTMLEGSGNAFRAFEQAIKQMLVQLGAAILKAALFAAILSVINPFATGVPGASGFSAIFKSLFHFAQGGEVKGYAGGGSISGPGTSTSDSIHAMLSKGEYVMNAASVSKFGSNFFDNLNSGLMPRFSGGGPVSGSMPTASLQGINVYVTGKVSGSELLLLHDRAVARRGRNT